MSVLLLRYMILSDALDSNSVVLAVPTLQTGPGRKSRRLMSSARPKYASDSDDDTSDNEGLTSGESDINADVPSTSNAATGKTDSQHQAAASSKCGLAAQAGAAGVTGVATAPQAPATTPKKAAPAKPTAGMLCEVLFCCLLHCFAALLWVNCLVK